MAMRLLVFVLQALRLDGDVEGLFDVFRRGPKMRLRPFAALQPVLNMTLEQITDYLDLCRCFLIALALSLDVSIHLGQIQPNPGNRLLIDILFNKRLIQRGDLGFQIREIFIRRRVLGVEKQAGAAKN
jgi:hypothetical protein